MQVSDFLSTHQCSFSFQLLNKKNIHTPGNVYKRKSMLEAEVEEQQEEILSKFVCTEHHQLPNVVAGLAPARFHLQVCVYRASPASRGEGTDLCDQRARKLFANAARFHHYGRH